MARFFLPTGNGGDKQIVNLPSISLNLSLPAFSSHQAGSLAILGILGFINAEYGDQDIMAFSVRLGTIKTGIEMHNLQEICWMLTDTPELTHDTVVYFTQKSQKVLNRAMSTARRVSSHSLPQDPISVCGKGWHCRERHVND